MVGEQMSQDQSGNEAGIEECKPLLWLFEALGLSRDQRPPSFEEILDWCSALDYARQEQMVKQLGTLVQKSSRGQRALASAFLFAIDFVHVDETARAGMDGTPSFLSDLNGTDRFHREAVLSLLASK